MLDTLRPSAGQLRQDLFRRQVAHQLLRAGVAERAGQRAADLAGDAECAAAFLGNVDGLDLDRPAGAARRKAEQPLARAIGGNLLLDDLGTRDGEVLGKLGAQVLGDVEHVGEVGDAADIEPVPELLDAHLGLAFGDDARGDESFREFLAGEADQRLLDGRSNSGAQRVAGGIGGEVERNGHSGSASYRYRQM